MSARPPDSFSATRLLGRVARFAAGILLLLGLAGCLGVFTASWNLSRPSAPAAQGE